jgi:hypothetical protein
MSQEPAVYDLGEVEASSGPSPVEPAAYQNRTAGSSALADPPKAATSNAVAQAAADVRRASVAPPSPTRVTQRPVRPRPTRVQHGWQAGPSLTGSLSVLFPGTGQVVAGEVGFGMLLISATGLAVALSWAVLETFDRLVPTLSLLGLPVGAPVWILAALFVLAAACHVFGAVHAQGIGVRYEPARGPHPVLTGVASGLLPGWGQLLNGHRWRATMFLAGMWGLAVVALLLSSPLHPALQGASTALAGSVPLRLGRGILITIAAVGWSLAVYDAVAGAVARRREWAGAAGPDAL